MPQFDKVEAFSVFGLYWKVTTDIALNVSNSSSFNLYYGYFL